MLYLSLIYSGEVTGTESIFITESRRKRQTNDEFVPIFFEDLTITDDQRMVCGNDEACLFDFAVTQDIDLANNNLEQQRETNETVEVASKFISCLWLVPVSSTESSNLIGLRRGYISNIQNFIVLVAVHEMLFPSN